MLRVAIAVAGIFLFLGWQEPATPTATFGANVARLWRNDGLLSRTGPAVGKTNR